jgi:CheY-like chemotaxis protein
MDTRSIARPSYPVRAARTPPPTNRPRRIHDSHPLAELRAPESTRPITSDRDPAAASNGLRILVVDDNTEAAELPGEWLRATGHTTRVAFDGPQAIEAAQQFQPEVALIDLGLPVMDGFEVARALSSSPQTSNVALVAVTGYGQAMDRARTRDAGFEEHLVKPIDFEQLELWLRRRCPSARAEGSYPCRTGGLLRSGSLAADGRRCAADGPQLIRSCQDESWTGRFGT